MSRDSFLWAVIAMAVVTFLPRFIPAWLLSSRSLPPWLEEWLRMVPAAVLSAMLLPSLLFQDGRFDVSLDNSFLLAALPTFAIAYFSKSLFASIAAGMIIVAAGRYFVGW